MAQLRFYGGIAQCGLIVLAGSHDNGYANPIRSLTTEGKDVVLLEGVPVAAELRGLCPVANIPGLLRKEKISWNEKTMMSGPGGSFYHSTAVASSPGPALAKRQMNTAKISPIARASMETGDPDDAGASEDDSEGWASSVEMDSDNVPIFEYRHIQALTRKMAQAKVSEESSKNRPTDSGEDTGAERQQSSTTKPANLSTTTLTPKKEKRALKRAAAAAAAGASGSHSGTAQEVTIPGDAQALRTLTPRPCHK